jgi:hypothetical protein
MTDETQCRSMFIDPANCSGVAIYGDGSKLLQTLVVKPMGGKGRWYAGAEVYPSQREAWSAVYAAANPSMVGIERGFGGMATAIRAQGMQIGYHRCFCQWVCVPPPVEINVQEWRRCIAEELHVSWPRDSDRCKALSVRIVEQLHGLTMTADECDAVLMGRAAHRMGLTAREGGAK